MKNFVIIDDLIEKNKQSADIEKTKKWLKETFEKRLEKTKLKIIINGNK